MEKEEMKLTLSADLAGRKDILQQLENNPMFHRIPIHNAIVRYGAISWNRYGSNNNETQWHYDASQVKQIVELFDIAEKLNQVYFSHLVQSLITWLTTEHVINIPRKIFKTYRQVRGLPEVAFASCSDVSVSALMEKSFSALYSNYDDDEAPTKLRWVLGDFVRSRLQNHAYRTWEEAGKPTAKWSDIDDKAFRRRKIHLPIDGVDLTRVQSTSYMVDFYTPEIFDNCTKLRNHCKFNGNNGSGASFGTNDHAKIMAIAGICSLLVDADFMAFTEKYVLDGTNIITIVK